MLRALTSPRARASRAIARPVTRATASMVRSSWVGPRPPDTQTRSYPSPSRRARAPPIASMPSPTISTRATSTRRASRERARMPALRSWIRPRRISSPVTRIAARGPAPSADALHPAGRDQPGATGRAVEGRGLAGDGHLELGRVGGPHPDPVDDLEAHRRAGGQRPLHDEPALGVLGPHLDVAPVRAHALQDDRGLLGAHGRLGGGRAHQEDLD